MHFFTKIRKTNKQTKNTISIIVKLGRTKFILMFPLPYFFSDVSPVIIMSDFSIATLEKNNLYNEILP